jgi:hypothetical protein
VVYNCCWPSPAQSFSSPKFCGTHDHILLSQNCDSHKLESQVPIFISLLNRVAQLYPHALGSLFITSYNLQGYGGGIRTHLHHWSTYPIGPHGIASGQTQQKSYFLAAVILHRHKASGVDRTEITASNSSYIVACITVVMLAWSFVFNCCVSLYCAITY